MQDKWKYRHHTGDFNQKLQASRVIGFDVLVRGQIGICGVVVVK